MDDVYLPEEIQEKIVKEHSVSFDQLVSFSGVCTSWNSAAHELYNRRCSFPGILVSKTSDCDDCRTGKRHRCNHRTNSGGSYHQFRPISTLFNSPVTPPPRILRSPQDCPTRRMILLPDIEGTEVNIDLIRCKCMASKDGWLVLVQERSHPLPVRIFLLNPITGASIALPFPLKFRSLSHVVLSSSPGNHDCHVIIFRNPDYRGDDDIPQVAWCKVSGGGWKFTRRNSRFFNHVRSASYIGGKLYVVDIERYVHVFDKLINVTGDPPPPAVLRSLKLPGTRPTPYYDHDRSRYCYYSMELNCQLIIVRRCFRECETRFQVYMLDGQDTRNWTEVTSLDGHAVFLGTRQSFCVPVLQSNGMIKADHVYYMSNKVRECWVYSLKEQKEVERSDLPDDDYQDYTWLLPMPWDIHKHLPVDRP
ncbi:hypothetical protein LINGRAHAP2_LOCUS33831 [Linum grandiflorum]